MNILLKRYTESEREKWDTFVMKKSANGTFMHTRSFLSYHIEKKYIDISLLFYNGNELIAVLPANLIYSGEKKEIVSHEGATFGGIVIGKDFNKITYVKCIFEELEKFFTVEGISVVKMKSPSEIYTDCDSALLEYFYYLYGYKELSELGYSIEYSDYNNDIISNFTSSKRRDYKYSLKNNLKFRELITDEEIKAFYSVLCDNYTKFGKGPAHSVEEMCILKKSIMQDECRFFGVYMNENMVAGGMVFHYKKHAFHTQYLAAVQDQIKNFVNDFLYYNLICIAKNEGFERLALGISTNNSGKELIESLAKFKEGFGAKAYVNRSFVKTY